MTHPTSPAHAVILAVRDDLRACLLERDAAIDHALLALLCGEHYLQLGPPGAAKSLLIRALAQRLTGATYFEKLMTAFTVPEELLGPIDLVRYADQGEYRRIASGSLATAQVAMLDEVFKANSAILNSLLTLMNERLLHEVGMPPVSVPLLSLFGASNETPSDSALDALDDRFLLRDLVAYVSSDAAFAQLIAAPLDRQAIGATVDLATLATAQAEARQVKGTPEALQMLIDLRHALSAEGVLVSDRRWRQCGKALKAWAWLEGDAELLPEHGVCLTAALWRDPKQRALVERLVYQAACPLALRAVEIEDTAQEAYANVPPVDHSDYTWRAENVLLSLTDMHAQLTAALDASGAKARGRAEQALQTIAGLHGQLSQQLYQSISRMQLAQ